jgi:hypothetical protein
MISSHEHRPVKGGRLYGHPRADPGSPSLRADHGAVRSFGAARASDAYRNPDGGYGWGLEPDLRSRESQPAAAAHAFEVFEEIAPATAPQAAALRDWLDSVTLPDGGLPFALPLGSTTGSAPFWIAADPSESSL